MDRHHSPPRASPLSGLQPVAARPFGPVPGLEGPDGQQEIRRENQKPGNKGEQEHGEKRRADGNVCWDASQLHGGTLTRRLWCLHSQSRAPHREACGPLVAESSGASMTALSRDLSTRRPGLRAGTPSVSAIALIAAPCRRVSALGWTPFSATKVRGYGSRRGGRDDVEERHTEASNRPGSAAPA